MAKIRGTWYFNSVISEIPAYETVTFQFTCGDTNYEGLGMDWRGGDGLMFYIENAGITGVSSPPLYYAGGQYWFNPECRTIDFGTVPQEISDEFYTWLKNNAISLTLEGKWRFNSVLNLPSTYVDCRADEQTNTELFISNNQTYYYLACYAQNGPDPWMLMYGWGMKFPYGTTDTTIGWIDEADQIIEFINPIGVTVDFATWFYANAKPAGQKLYTEFYIQDIAAEIHKNGINDTFKVSEMPAMINSVVNTKYDAGKVEGAQLQKDAFWEGFQMGTGSLRKNYAHAFASAKFGDMLPPKYDITPAGSNNYAGTNADHMFYGNRDDLAPLTAVTIDFSQSTNNNYLFGGCYTPEIPFEVSMVSDNKSTGVFSYLVNCETIKKIVVNENNTFTSWFADSKKLKNVTFEGTIANNIDFSACKSLTGRSITNIVEHLSDDVTGKTLTLSQAAVDNATFSNTDTLYFTTNGAYSDYLESEPIHLTAGQTIRVTSDWEDGHRLDDGATDWWFGSAGTTTNGGTPDWSNDWTYTAETDEDVIVLWYFASVSGEPIYDIPVTIRIVLIDEQGNEITGENLNVLNSVTGDAAILQIEPKTLTWQELKAKKPNWSYGLIQ